MSRLAITGLVLAALSLAACGTLSARPDPSRFYTLTPLAQTPSIETKTSEDRISLGLGPVKLPGYLDRQEMVTRAGQNRIGVSDYDRWAEPLDENFAWVLSQNLAVLMASGRVVPYPWALDRSPSYQVEVDVLRFEMDGAREAQLSARWTLFELSSRKTLAARESRVTRQAKESSTEAAVAALSEAVADLSREIADVIRDIDGRKK